MTKSAKKWDVIYERVDIRNHKSVKCFAAQDVDYKTALAVKRNNKKACAMKIVPAQRQGETA